MRKLLVALAVIATAGALPAARADHDPAHDPRHNPNCAWDSSRSADWDGDGQPDHMVLGVAHNTSFPRQVVTMTEPYTGMDHVPPFFGSDDGPDNATVVVQGDHRMLGANPAHTEEGDPEQQHNGAIRAHVDYDDVENGRTPRAEWGFGIYEANHLVMACGSTDGDPEAAACLAGNEIYRMTDEDCPED
ncbi:MAG TPA: hypothetical protein VGB52_12945 [Actinomycetota bacterium]